ncbi:MAG: hypothetical protein J2P54_16820 [Bradyrhizobiaceae bacterium]|nr:hypothetical protein [Bradyrhizobiaceae bacterium]
MKQHGYLAADLSIAIDATSGSLAWRIDITAIAFSAHVRTVAERKKLKLSPAKARACGRA